MKRTIYIALVMLSTLSFTGCKKFLEVSPKTEVPQEELFKTEAGFKSALAGVYTKMRVSDAYGSALTQTTVESLVSSWDATAGSLDLKIGAFNYTDEAVETAFEKIYAQEYRVISSINAILGAIDLNQSVFTTPGTYEMIKAECLALRAYCHLDVIRLFGPVPGSPTADNLYRYVKQLTITLNPKKSFADFKTALLQDITDAAALAKTVDPIVTGNPASADALFFLVRNNRMNYYAIKGLQARAYLWFGDNTNALDAAKVVIDAKNANGSSKFTLGTAADLAAGDYTLSKEHLFGLTDPNIGTTYSTRYGSGSTKKGANASALINPRLFTNNSVDSFDIRRTGLWELVAIGSGGTGYVIKKYKYPGAAEAVIPMLRLSEMYLIAAETSAYADGVAYWRTFKNARNLNGTATPADAVALKTDIIKEYRKEFYAEGQAFYMYKRTNTAGTTNFIFLPTTAVIDYVVPVPLSDF